MAALSLLNAHVELAFGQNLTDADRARLGPHISNYNRLNEILVLNGIPISDIQKLILLELEGAQRPFILKKLVGRLKSKERKELLNIIATCVKAVSKPKSPVTRNRKGVSRTSSRRRRNAASPIESSSPPTEKSSS